MGLIKYFDIALPIIDEASKKFLEKPNPEYLDIFKEYCEIIDDLAEEFDGKCCDIKVDEATKRITINFECKNIIINKRIHMLYALIEVAAGLGFSPAKDADNILITFIFPGVWNSI